MRKLFYPVAEAVRLWKRRLNQARPNSDEFGYLQSSPVAEAVRLWTARSMALVLMAFFATTALAGPDGIDVLSVTNTRIDHVFVTATDDALCIKARNFDSSVQDADPARDNRNIITTNAVIYQTGYRATKFGTETAAALFEDILYENIYVARAGPNQANTIYLADSAEVRNVVYRNFYAPGNNWAADITPFGRPMWPSARIHQISLRNFVGNVVRFSGSSTSDYLISDSVVTNFWRQGSVTTDKNHLTFNSYVDVDSISLEANPVYALDFAFPIESSRHLRPALLYIEAEVRHDDGLPLTVEFFADGVSIGTATSAPYSIEWDAPDGWHNLTFTVTDAHGNSDTLATPRRVEVRSAPVFSAIRVFPGNPEIGPGLEKQFTARALDQYGETFYPQPTAWTWSADSGGIFFRPREGLFRAADSDGGPHTVRVSATIDGVTVEATSTFTITSELSITDMLVASGKEYVWDILEAGKLRYIDRTSTFSNVGVYGGRLYLRNSNSDKDRQGTMVSFRVNLPVTVYIAVANDFDTNTPWFANYAPTGTTLNGFTVYAQTFAPGMISLGDNGGADNVYHVVIEVAESVPASTPYAHPLVPDLPEPLMTRYILGIPPTVKTELEARIAAVRDSAVWISPDGLPGAAGTEADPMNLAEGSAFVSQTANRGRSVLFHPGVYDARGFSNIINYGSHLTSASDFVIAAPDGPAVFNAGHTVPLSDMTDNGDGTWSFSFDGSLRDTPTDNRLMMVTVGGDGRSYFSQRNSTAEVAAQARSYHYDVATQTVTLRFEADPTDVVISCSLRFASFQSAGATVGMYGLDLNHFRSGGPHLSNIDFSAYDVHVNYAWDFQGRTDGWGIGNNTTAIFENCSANFVQNDGFNSRGDNIHLRLVNSRAIGNNDDGYSPHRSGEYWEVWGGLYQNNGKGNITPAGGYGFIIGATLDTTLGRMDGYSDSGSFRGLSLISGENHPVVWIKDSIIRDVGANSKAVYNQNAESHVRLENTIIEGASVGLFSTQGGKILAINPTFIGNIVDYNTSNANIVVVYTGIDDPVASFTATPEFGHAPLEVAFNGAASHADGATLTRYDWNFGDGTQALDAGPYVTHTFTEEGEYLVLLTVTDSNERTGSTGRTITVGNVAPTAVLTATPTAGVDPLPVSFDASASFDPDGTITRYDWNFGDGNTVADGGANRQHTYLAPGTYTATVTVTDDSGATDTASVEITIYEASDVFPIYFFDFDANGGVGSTVNDVSGVGDPAHGTTFIWDTGVNGNVATDLFTSVTPGSGFGGDFTANRSSMEFSGAKWNERVAGNSNAFTFVWAMRLQGFGSSGNNADRAFFENTTNSGFRIGGTTGDENGNVRIRADIGSASGGTANLDASGDIIVAVTWSAEDPVFRVYAGTTYETLALHDSVAINASSVPLVTTMRMGDISARDPNWLVDDVRIYDSVLNIADLRAIGLGGGGPIPADPPSAPSGLVATSVGPTSVGLSWTDNSAGTASFEVRLADGTVVATAAAGETSAIVGDLDPDTDYTFTVRAVNSAGASADSNAVTVRTEFVVTHTVSFAANGGSGTAPDSESVILGELFTVPGQGDLTKAGHTFNGWRDNLAAVTYSAGDTFAMPAADVELAAQWTLLGDSGEYVQPFNNTTNQLLVENAGIGWQRAAHNGNLSADQVGRLSNANGPDGQQGFAYTFRGGNNASLMWYEGLTFSQDTLQAFSAYVGHSHGSNVIRFLIRVGDNWYASADGGGKAPGVGDGAWFENGATQYTLTFSPENTWVPVVGFNGTSSGTFTLLGSGDLTPLAALPAGDVTAVGVYLANLGGGSTRFDDFTVTWTAPGSGHTVTYAANGGTGAVPEDLNQYATGTTITVMGQGGVTREGFEFLGWRDEVAGETYAPLATFTMPERDVTLVAQWTADAAPDPYADWAAANNITGGLADETGGVANLLRYALGGDATTPLAGLLPDMQSTPTVDGLTLTLTFHRIDDDAVTYSVFYSTDLIDWGTSPVWQGTGAHEGEPGGFAVEVLVPTPGNRGFLRLEVERPE
jgi:uncharacterized repeat protein (TIGR02543 family)